MLEALLIAIRDHHYGRVLRLLKAGVDPNLPTGAWSALRSAIFWNDIRYARALLRHGANPDFGGDGDSPLHVALQNAKFDVVYLLIDAGADINSSSHNGFTPLMHAVLHGNIELACLLIARGANVNALDANGNSALLLAAINKKKRLTALLLEAGAETRVRNIHGITYQRVISGKPLPAWTRR